MPKIFEVTEKDISSLDERQITDLLSRLLFLEAAQHNIPLSSIEVSPEINTSDEGEDGRIKWEGNPDHTDFIPNRFTGFQCKATKMPPSKCKKEIIIKGTNQIKPRIEEALDAGGCYILFCRDTYNPSQKIKRINAFREAIEASGKGYTNTADVRIYDGNQIANWVNKYISAITAVCNWIGRSLPEGLQTWQTWRGYQENRYSYIIDETLEGNINQLRKNFRESRKVARIVGLSGLGKTRLAFETFRPPKCPKDDSKQQALSDQIVYIDAVDIGSGLPNIIKQWRDQQLMGILVVDNCDIELHNKLQKEVGHEESQLSLLTMDYDPNQYGADYTYIKLERTSDKIIEGILKQVYPDLPESDIHRIVEFAQGYPQMAILLGEARLNEEPSIGNIKDDVLVKKLLWGRKQEDKEALEVISACAIFDHIGFENDVVEQRYFIADKICRISRDKIYSICQEFIERGILDKRYRYIRVVPLPLAIRLAADWWKKCPPEKAKELFEEKMPRGMLEALCDQISRLHFLPKAREITRDICGEQAPFGQAEVLNSEKGSRAFRSLVEVNPQVTADTLQRIFGGWTRDQLLQVGPGRRNLIWALEKLCFWKDTFPIASRILLAFAAAENETWGNNATNQFLQLFHVYLSGTQAPPSARLAVIDEALMSDIVECRILAVKALGHVLIAHHFSRMGGVERQGSRVSQEDWKPRTRKDILDYWLASLERLTPIACGKDTLAELAREQITHNIRGLIQNGLLNNIEAALITIGEKHYFFWPEAYDKIRDVIRYDHENLPSEEQNRLERLQEKFEPHTMSERLKMIVGIPDWEYTVDENGNHIDLAEKKAITLAHECAKSLPSLFENLHYIFKGEQMQGYVFGFTLGEILDNPEQFIEKAFSILSCIPKEKANLIVLGGFLAALRSRYPSMVESTLENVAHNDSLYIHAINLTRLSKPNLYDLKRIVELVKSEKVRIDDLIIFAYGSVLDHEIPKTIVSFCEDIIALNSKGAFIAHEIISMYCHKEPDRFKICQEEFRRILLIDGLLQDIIKSSILIRHNWQRTTKALLGIEGGDSELAQHICKEIIGLCSLESYFNSFVDELESVIQILLSLYLDMTWRILSEGLLSDNKLLKYNLVGVLNPPFKSNDLSVSTLSCVPDDFLIEWCKGNEKKAPEALAQIIPLFMRNEEEFSWHPIAQFLIDNYGDRSEILSIMQNRIMTIAMTSSITDVFKQRMVVMKNLLTHKNDFVRKWASEVSRNIQYDIEIVKKREEELDLGIF